MPYIIMSTYLNGAGFVSFPIGMVFFLGGLDDPPKIWRLVTHDLQARKRK